MCSCEFNEIPKHLHADGRKRIEHFYSSEFLFRRDDFKKELNISKISLAHLSVNRSGTEENMISDESDARHFIDADGNYQKFEGQIDRLAVAESGLEDGQVKSYSEKYEVNGKEEVAHARVMLRHDPEPCNYAHSTFEFDLNGVRMVVFPKDESTYSGGLGKGAKYVRRLRTAIRDDISKMIEEDW